MKLIKELSTTLLESDASERQRARVYGALQRMLDKEFSGNDALATDLLNGMMDFYDGPPALDNEEFCRCHARC